MPSRPQRRRFGASQKERIFFACLPDTETAERIYALAERLKRANGFEGTLVLPNHLHVTLYHLGDWPSLPGPVVSAAQEAAAQINVPAFDVAFTRSESFRRGMGPFPFVLTCEQDAPCWTAVRRPLGQAMERVGLGGATRGQFTPHMTLLRDDKRAVTAPIEPIRWTVRELVLVHSLLGKTTHIHLGRWPFEIANA
jgi:RNA 2',3'-cyclic 3'-phosphodiesterase